MLCRQVMKCDFDSNTDDKLRYQLVVGDYKEDVRRRLLANENLTLQSEMNIIALEEQVEKDTSLFNRLRASNEVSPRIEEAQQVSHVKNQNIKTATKKESKCYRCGCPHDNPQG